MNEMIKTTMNTMPDSSLSEAFVEAVFRRLISFGYVLDCGKDSFALCFAMLKVENHIKNSCNTTFVPDGLFHVAVDMSCGEFLFAKKQIGQLEIGNLDLTGAITSISEGDTSVFFADGMSDEEKFNQLLNYMMTKGEGEFVCYRTLRW